MEGNLLDTFECFARSFFESHLMPKHRFCRTSSSVAQDWTWSTVGANSDINYDVNRCKMSLNMFKL